MAESKAEERISSERSMGTRAEDNTPEGESDKLKMTDGIILDLAANQELQRFQEEGDLDEILTRMERESGISSTNTNSLENTRPNTPEGRSEKVILEEFNFQKENMTKSKLENTSSRALELDLAHTKDRLAAKEKEVEGLYKQILNQDKAFAEAYREQEASFREREEKLIVKLFDEVKNQTDQRIEQQRKIGEQEERIRNLERQLELYRRNEQSHYENDMISN
ncbi:Oidioi.mRNA.OKI2018_I69.chr1.g348.t1.cds [Oikopleura dioica]|uniref:Oidioi.mRNA.OKI2018_I69.chr1.g348.t1.cds n=1 Tax=Oikopleura dioica TaxID=34765 RepID=A0ABN7SPS3_OIKDI|nr:Oidioi.mRNA.OKI2018_I69.chr1.g348.t1.cds [Oikopleura dioica]